MKLRFFHLLFLWLLVYFSFGQILPEPGAKLNYTQIMFEHPQLTGADEYLVQVIPDEKNFSFEHPAFSHRDSSTATMISNFEFGKKYVWRYAGLNNGKELGWHGPYKFEILSDIYVNKKFCRVRILQNDSLANAGGLISLDMAHTVIDRQGNFVWFLPPDSGTHEQRDTARHPVPVLNDLYITPFGTVTSINGARDEAEERDLRGKILWQAPPRSAFSEDSSNIDPPYDYHHCFKRLSSGNYVVMDRINVSKLVPGDTMNVLVASEILRELDAKGSLVWSWSSENYFDTAELKKMIRSEPDPAVLNPTPGGHMNAFDVDEKNGFVYAGFRNVSRVIKID